jgi:hypothetical protein
MTDGGLSLRSYSAGCPTRPFRAIAFLAVVLSLGGPGAVAAQTVVEFYNPDLDNYFITADPAEQAMIDKGGVGRWMRTTGGFKAGGNSTVCRFYGNGAINPATGAIYGPNSHFYTADPAECANLKAIFDPKAKSWKFESNDFATNVASAGACATGLVPVYRAYNNGFSRGVDSNHRITSNYPAYQQTVAAGWTGEGVVMCAPGQLLTGVVFNGTITGATITASSIQNGVKGSALGSGGTDPNGNFTISIGNYVGPVLVEANGGSYIDELSGTAVNLDSTLRAVVPNALGTSTVVVTALTEAAVQNALTDQGGLTLGNVFAENQRVQQEFGFDATKTVPQVATDSGVTNATPEVRAYSAYIAGVSQYMKSSATALKSTEKAKTLGSAIADYAAAIKAGGISSNQAIVIAQNDFLTSAKNKTGVPDAPGLINLSWSLVKSHPAFPTFAPEVAIAGSGNVDSGFTLSGYQSPVGDPGNSTLFASLWMEALVGQTVTIKRPQDYSSACQSAGNGSFLVREKFVAFSGACQGSSDCSFIIAPAKDAQIREDWTYEQVACGVFFQQAAGVWSGSVNGSNVPVVVRFDGNGNYSQGNAQGSSPGIERGVVNYDAATGRFTVVISQQTDNLTGLAALAQAQDTMAFDSNGEISIKRPDGTEAMHLKRVANDAGGIVGAWGSATDLGTQYFVFFPSGRYVMADPIGDAGCGSPGVENGTYSFVQNGGTATLIKTGTTVDTNGCAGLNPGEGNAIAFAPDFMSATITNKDGSFLFQRLSR